MQKTSKNMQKQQKSNKVLKLRQKGYGYKSIARMLNLKRDYVREYCYRKGLGGYLGYGNSVIPQPKIIEQNYPTRCKQCDSEINTERRKGRKSIFCCERCRRTWWNENSDKKNKITWYTLTCKHCNKEFKAYVNKNRKFCSIECSREYRCRKIDKINIESDKI